MSNVSAVAVISCSGGLIATAADALMFQLRYITVTYEAYRYRIRIVSVYGIKNRYIVSVENGVLGLTLVIHDPPLL